MGVTADQGKSLRFYHQIHNDLEPVTVFTSFEKSKSTSIPFSVSDELARKLVKFSGYYMKNFNEDANAVVILGKMKCTKNKTYYTVEIGFGNRKDGMTKFPNSEYPTVSFDSNNLLKFSGYKLQLQRISFLNQVNQTVTMDDTDDNDSYFASTDWNAIPFSTLKDRPLLAKDHKHSITITEKKGYAIAIAGGRKGVVVSTEFTYDLLNQVVTFDDHPYKLFFCIDGRKGISCRIEKASRLIAIVSEIYYFKRDIELIRL